MFDEKDAHQKPAQIEASFPKKKQKTEELTGITHQQVSKWAKAIKDETAYLPRPPL
jgi:hypothetical protein